MTHVGCQESRSTEKQSAALPKATACSSRLHRKNCTLPIGNSEPLCASMIVVTLQSNTDSGRLVEFNLKDHPHLDYGFAVTSHSSQGQTADRVLIQADTEQSAHLVNSRIAYVAVSRGRYDAQIYTNDKSELAEQLNRDVSQRTALLVGHDPGIDAGHKIASSSVSHDPIHDHGVAAQSSSHGAGEGHGQAVGQ